MAVEFMKVNMPWCDTHFSVNINTGQVTRSSSADHDQTEKLEIFKNTPFTSEEIWVALYDLDHNTRWELGRAIERCDEHWAGNDVLINMAIHLPDETENWPEWMRLMYEKVTETIMDFSPPTRDWLHAIRIGEMERKLRHLWATAMQHEKHRRIFDCTSKGPTEEQAIREHRETRNHTKNVVQTIILEVKNQLTKRGKENHARISKEWLLRDNAARQEMQEEQQQAVPMETDAVSPPTPPCSYFPEGSRVAWLLAMAQAQRALQIKPDAERDPDYETQEGVDGQIPTPQTISDDEGVPASCGEKWSGNGDLCKTAKRYASVPKQTDKNKKQKRTKFFTCGRC